MTRLKLIVLDVDGVLSTGEAHTLDLSLLERLARLNRRARQDSRFPAVTLNTGRPSPYVEAIMQAIDGWQPALFESGAGLYFPRDYRFQLTPRLSAEQTEVLHEIVAALDRELVQSGRAYWQLGKSVCHSLFAQPPEDMDDIARDVEAIVAAWSDQFAITPAVKALNIHPAAVNKATGLAWLAEVTGIEPAAMGAVGDTAGDVEFLRAAGHPAAPANAIAAVKAVARYVSPHRDAAGLHDILDHWRLHPAAETGED